MDRDTIIVLDNTTKHAEDKYKRLLAIEQLRVVYCSSKDELPELFRKNRDRVRSLIVDDDYIVQRRVAENLRWGRYGRGRIQRIPVLFRSMEHLPGLDSFHPPVQQVDKDKGSMDMVVAFANTGHLPALPEAIDALTKCNAKVDTLIGVLCDRTSDQKLDFVAACKKIKPGIKTPADAVHWLDDLYRSSFKGDGPDTEHMQRLYALLDTSELGLAHPEQGHQFAILVGVIKDTLHGRLGIELT